MSLDNWTAMWAEHKRLSQAFPEIEVLVQIDKKLTRRWGQVRKMPDIPHSYLVKLSYYLPGSDEALDTLRHEWAHVLARELYGKWGHGGTWRMLAAELGAAPKRCAPAQLPSPKLVPTCEDCGNKHRPRSRKISGGRCATCRSSKIAWVRYEPTRT